jgi:hypothetical protein
MTPLTRSGSESSRRRRPLFNLFFQSRTLENYHPASVGDKVLYTDANKGMVESPCDPYSTYMD